MQLKKEERKELLVKKNRDYNFNKVNPLSILTLNKLYFNTHYDKIAYMKR